jgi:hypothetical protein
LRLACAIALVLAACGPASAAEGDLRLRDAPGRELVQAHCGTCHSLDYIEMNSPFLDRDGWTRSVEKMIQVMGAPIPRGDVTPIVDYLATAYGKSDGVTRE